MPSGNKKFEYHPIKNPPSYEDSNIRQKLDKFRRTKSQSLFIFIVFLLVTYILLSVLLPDNWFSIYSDSSYNYYDTSSTALESDSSAINNETYKGNTSTLSSLTANDSSVISNKSITNVPKIEPEVGTSTALIVTNATDKMLSTVAPQLNISKEEKITCQIPMLDPYDSSIKHLVMKPGEVHLDCTSEFPLLFESLLDRTIVPMTGTIRSKGYKSCCYRILQRKDPKTNENPDKGYKKSKICFAMSLKLNKKYLKPKYEFLAIYCSNETYSANKNVSENIVDIHVLVHLKPKVEERIKNYYEDIKEAYNETEEAEPEVKLENTTSPTNTSSTKHSTNLENYDVNFEDDNSTSEEETFWEESERFNVVILGIDAVSHMNFLRIMPKSYKYLMKELGAVEMHGYNKIGDNTYPNMAAVLTSYNTTEMKSCEVNETFDNCPFIWKEYANHGFRTSFAEDSTWMGIFNYLRKGFRHQPTDYYLRPFGNAADELIGTHKRLNAKLCHGPRLTFHVLLDYMRKVAYRMGHDKRYFQLVWATSLTHDYLNDGQLGDNKLFWTLQWFKTQGYLNHTAFILMSDHGIRWGEIHDFPQGETEERLPFMYFVMPSVFQERFPTAYRNLQKNVNRLTTPFDFHETLRDLLFMEGIEEEELMRREEALDEAVRKKEGVPRGISHFLKIPASRTCEMAEVAEHFCTCHKTVPVPTKDSTVEQAANFLVYTINNMISKFKECAYLKLEEIKRAVEIKSDFDKWQGIQVVVETKPGGAVFDSLLEKEKGFWKVSGTISRTNLYGNQSHCVSKKEIKLYCFCVDMIEDEKN